MSEHQVENTTLPSHALGLFRFFVRSMFSAKPAELLILDAAGLLFLILGRRIISTLAL